MKKAVISVVIIFLAISGLAQEKPELRATVLNVGFEAPSILNGADIGTVPDKWFPFSSTGENKSGITDERKRSGLQSFFFKCQKKADAYSGIAQKFMAVPGRRFEFSVFAISDPSDPLVGQAFGQLSLEWRDEAGVEITRNYGPAWNFDLSPIRWEKFMVGAAAPEGAVVGQAVLTFYSRDGEGFGKCYIDDSKLVKKSGSK